MNRTEVASSLLFLPWAVTGGPYRKDAFEKLKSDLPASGELLSENCLGTLCRCMVIELQMLFGLRRFELDFVLEKTMPV